MSLRRRYTAPATIGTRQTRLHIDRAATSLSGHYAIYDSNSYLPFDFGFTVSALPGYGDYHNNRGQNVGIDWTHASPRTQSTIFASATTATGLRSFSRTTASIAAPSWVILSPPNPQDWGYPDMLINGYETLGEPFNAPQNIIDNAYQVTDNVTWSPQFDGGRHRFKFGGDFHRIQQNGYVDFYSRGLWLFIGITGSSLEDVLIGLPAVSLFASGDTETHFRSFLRILLCD